MFSKEFFSVWVGVLFLFALGNSAIAIVGWLLYFVGFSGLLDGFSGLFAQKMYLVSVLVGCFMTAVAIYDGNFVGRVKKSHWSRKDRGQE
jgi:hypothetical protein